MRTILHSDCNSFYASVEQLYNPRLRGIPMAVGGSAESRHGIILAKSEEAKKFQIKTGEAIWEAKQKCRDLVVVPPNFERYLRFSKISKEIYREYTDQEQSFGLDESWVDVTYSESLFGDGLTVANKIRNRIRRELGITVSIGLSYNKIFAKLGSDIAKKDSVYTIGKDDFKDTVWKLPVSDLLYVGRATTAKLKNRWINTIGDLANADPDNLKRMLGKWGITLWQYANGLDNSPVTNENYHSPIKSIGNSTTAPHDLITDQDAKITIYTLAESVCARLRENGFVASTVQVSIRYDDLFSFERQEKLINPSCVSTTIGEKAFEIYKKHAGSKPVRSVGVRACNLIREQDMLQLSFHPGTKKEEKLRRIDNTVDHIRLRFGSKIIQRGIMLADKELSKVNPKDDHVIHPIAYSLS